MWYTNRYLVYLYCQAFFLKKVHIVYFSVLSHQLYFVMIYSIKILLQNKSSMCWEVCVNTLVTTQIDLSRMICLDPAAQHFPTCCCGSYVHPYIYLILDILFPFTFPAILISGPLDNVAKLWQSEPVCTLTENRILLCSLIHMFFLDTLWYFQEFP